MNVSVEKQIVLAQDSVKGETMILRQDAQPKCSNVECFCSQNNLCEEPSESEEYQQEICDKAQAGSKGKATIIVAFFIFILGGES